MIFYKEPTGLLNAYNNSIFEFGEGGNATILIEGYSFNVSADANGRFYFNLKEVIKSIINEVEFNDETTLSGAVTLDPTLSRTVEVTFTVDNVDTAVKTLTFIKAAHQIGEPSESDTLRPLLPSKSLTYFEGLPMDFSVYSSTNQTVDGISLTPGVNRVDVSRLPLSDCQEVEVLGVKIIKKPNPGGHQLKWFNQSGGWSYWAFLKYPIDSNRSKRLESVEKDTTDVEEARTNASTLGKLHSINRRLDTGLMDANEIAAMITLIRTPKVYIYKNGSWIEVEVLTTTINRDHSLEKQKYRIDIKLPETYTQLL